MGEADLGCLLLILKRFINCALHILKLKCTVPNTGGFLKRRLPPPPSKTKQNCVQNCLSFLSCLAHLVILRKKKRRQLMIPRSGVLSPWERTSTLFHSLKTNIGELVQPALGQKTEVERLQKNPLPVKENFHSITCTLQRVALATVCGFSRLYTI